MKWSLGLHSLLAASYPTHSCHTNPPKTPIFICHFSKTSFLASCCWKIVSRASVWHSRLSRIWTLPDISVLLISFTMHKPISQPSQQRYQASPRLVGSFSGVWKGYSWVTCQEAGAMVPQPDHMDWERNDGSPGVHWGITMRSYVAKQQRPTTTALTYSRQVFANICSKKETNELTLICASSTTHNSPRVYQANSTEGLSHSGT